MNRLTAPALALGLFVAGCGGVDAVTTQESTPLTDTQPSPEVSPASGLSDLDLAAPDDFATATFALG